MKEIHSIKINKMADITKCNNSECVLRKNCRRFTEVSGEIQSVMKFEPTKIGCNFFLECKGRNVEKHKLVK